MKSPFRKPTTERLSPRRRLSRDRQVRNDSLETVSPAASFRRNQTLTGSRSTDVRSASELSDQAVLRSPRATAHHLRAYRRRLGLYLLVGAAFSLVLYGTLYQLTNNVRVSLYGQVAPLASDDERRLESTVDRYLDQHPLERIRLFLNPDRLVAYFAEEDMREVYAVTKFEHDGIGRSHIQIKVREPIASWTIGNDRRYVDGNGVVFVNNYFDTPSVRIRDESGISLRGESQATAVTSTRFLRFIGQAVNALDQYGVDVATVSIPANTTRQVNLLIGKSRIMMTIDRPVGEQSEDAARAWKYLTTKKKSNNYLDVRVAGRAYYR